MKKILILMIIPILMLCGCSKKTYTEINYADLKQKIENNEDFILFIGADSCSHCATYKTTLNSVINDYNVDVYYIDIDNLSKKENSYLNALAPYTGTPTTVFIENGKEESTYNRIEGAMDYEYVVGKFKKNGYIEVK